jgi:hypothetical protein
LMMTTNKSGYSNTITWKPTCHWCARLAAEGLQ